MVSSFSGGVLALPADKSLGILASTLIALPEGLVLHLLHKRYGKIVCRGSRVPLGTYWFFTFTTLIGRELNNGFQFFRRGNKQLAGKVSKYG